MTGLLVGGDPMLRMTTATVLADATYDVLEAEHGPRRWC